MQTTSMTGRMAMPLATRVAKMAKRVNKWLDGKSEFYTKVCGEAVSRRMAIKVGTLLPATALTCIFSAGENWPLCLVSGIVTVAIVVSLRGKEASHE